MEKKKQNLDNFFRENLSDFQLSKKEGDWELLNQLLNEQGRKKRIGSWALFGFCFLIALTCNLFRLLNEKESAKNSKYEPLKSIPNTQSNINKIDVSNNDLEQISTGNRAHTLKAENEIVVSNANQNKTRIHSVIKGTNFNNGKQNISIADSVKTGIKQTVISKPLHTEYSEANDSNNSNTSSSAIKNQITISSDSVITVAKNQLSPDSTTPKFISGKRNLFNIGSYIGLNIYNTGNANNNISPIAGLEMKHAFSSKFSISLATLYSLQGGYNLTHTSKASQETYFLDKTENISEQTIQIRQMHKLYFPLTFYYSFTKNQTLLGSIQFSYLLNTNGDYIQKNTQSGITEVSRKNNVKGYMDGIKSSNMAAVLGYQFRINKLLDFSPRISHELTEIYNREYFNGIKSKSLISFQTFLIIKF